jgi:hypothetical protein
MMTKLITSLSLWLETVWSRMKVRGAERRLRERGLELAVERIVSQSNPALRGLPSYRRRLKPVVARLLEHVESLEAHLPGPTDVDPASWSADPLVNVLFGNVECIRRAVSGPAVRDWLKANPIETSDHLYGLLVAWPRERTQLGMELVGDHVQRDVKQRTLSFTDHELFGVGADLNETRRSLARQITDLLVSIGIGHIAEQEERMVDIETALRKLRIKLKVINPRVGGADLVLAGSSHHLAERERLEREIKTLEKDLADASRGLGDIEQYLNRLVEVLDHPEQELMLERMTLWVDRMNIVRDRADPDARQITLVRARRRDQPGRIAQLICFPRGLVISAEERLAAVERHLAK